MKVSINSLSLEKVGTIAEKIYKFLIFDLFSLPTDIMYDVMSEIFYILNIPEIFYYDVITVVSTHF